MSLQDLTANWGRQDDVRLYLSRCQVDTPIKVVRQTWELVHTRRAKVSSVVDFGAGDCRFARFGRYGRYTGYEIDPSRTPTARLPRGAVVRHRCAFSTTTETFDCAIGNPPFVRNQDLPEGWRQQAANVIRARTAIEISGLANAWQYFSFLSLATTTDDGLVALVVPYEWVSRPSSAALRSYIRAHGWAVDVYRLHDVTFDGVATTSCITLVDKADRSGTWRFFTPSGSGSFVASGSEVEHAAGILPFLPRGARRVGRPTVRRGLSPGSQAVLTLTESERIRHGLKRGTDLVPCVTTFRHLPSAVSNLTETAFERHFVRAGQKCWLVNLGRRPGPRLMRYLQSVPKAARQTATMENRRVWWAFTMPRIPQVLVATGFRGPHPKVALNGIGARNVGSVAGVFDIPRADARELARDLRALDLTGRLVAHAGGLKKIEIAQLEALVLAQLRGAGIRDD